MSLILKSIEIQNFKCFEDPQKIDLAKITLITGPNSSGKSSILYSVLGALQTDKFPYLFSPNGKYINMGDFKEIVFNHNENETIKLSYVFYSSKEKIEYNVKTEWRENRINKLPEILNLSVTSNSFSFTLQKDDFYYLDFTYDPSKDPDATAEKQKSYKSLMTTLAKLTVSETKQTKLPTSKKSAKSKPKEEFDFEAYASKYFNKYSCEKMKFKSLEEIQRPSQAHNPRLNQTVKKINEIFNEFDNKLNFISSFRLHPDRTYLEKAGTEKIKTFGQGYLDQLITWESNNQKLFDQIVSDMKKLNLLESIETNRIGGGRYEVVITNKNRKIKTPLTDVGFGISQFLPLIVADAQLGSDSTLFVAQPEIHLHPSAQASFGDYMHDKIKTKNKRYVIETHSEYLINRLRLKVVKGDIEPDEIKMYYIDTQKGVTKISEIQFGKKGELDGAPNSFFETYFLDVKDIALNSF